MANPIELANKARATLANALQAIQERPDTPDELMAIAEPIAKTMGVLHRVQRSEANKEDVQGALDTIRETLDTLQNIQADHPAVEEAMEGVAGSLSKLFALARAMPSSPPPAPAQPVAAEPEPPPPAPSTEPVTVPRPQTGPPQPAPTPPQVTGPQVAGQGVRTVPIQEVGAPQPQAPAQPAPQQPQPLTQTVPEPHPQAQPAPQPQAPGGAAPERVPGQTDAPIPSTGAKRLEVELGAHSPSNFYKGLSGNDVIDHGGIFVSTYQIPKVGDAVALRVLLPGDLEFEGDAIVQWIREVRGEGSDPGFGAKFTRISQEGRQLVYRYVRNREPMFYDDM